MPEEWIRFREGASETGIAKIKVEPSTVIARIEPIGTLLDIPFGWEWEVSHWREKQIHWDIISLSAELLWTNGSRLISSSLPANAIDSSPPRSLVFPLTLTQIEEVETLRDGSDATILLRITAHMQLIINANIARSGGIPSIYQVVVQSYQSQITMPITIPKSMWEKNVQPNLGIDGLSSLTVIFPPGIQKVFKAPLYELQQAERTLTTASTEVQFESVVLQCRNAIDSLLNQFTFQLPQKADGQVDASFSTRADALANQELINLLSESQAKAVAHILKDLWVPYSSATKPGPAHHSRAFATFALHQATSIIKLVSEVLSSKQKNK